MSEYKVGQQLYWEGFGENATKETVLITRIGSKWLTLSNGKKASKEDLMGEYGFYGFLGRCYPDRAKREEEVAREAIWRKFTAAVREDSSFRKDLPVDVILQAAKLLGYTL